MHCVIVELDNNAQFEALKKYIQSLGAKMRSLKDEEVQLLHTIDEMKIYGIAIREHSTKVLAKVVENETESMF